MLCSKFSFFFHLICKRHCQLININNQTRNEKKKKNTNLHARMYFCRYLKDDSYFIEYLMLIRAPGKEKTREDDIMGLSYKHEIKP